MNGKKTKPSILILLAKGLWNDSRVIKTAASLSELMEITILCHKSHKMVNPHLPYREIEVEARDGFWQRILSRTCFWLPYYRDTRDFRASLNTKYDIVWANDLPTLYTGSRIASETGAHLIYDSHEIYVETINQFFPDDSRGLKKWFHRANCALMKKMGKWAEKKYGDQATHVFAANDSFKDELRRRYGWKHMSSLYNMPEIQAPSKSLSTSIRDGYSDSEVIVLYHGSFSAGRGLKLLIEAIALLPDKFKLVLLGRGFYQSVMEKLIEAKSLESRVHFKAMVPEADLVDHIRGADVGINLLENFNLSKWLASPNKLFQYIHAGVPVVSSQTPENMKVLNRHTIGVSVDNNAESIAEGIRIVSENKAEYKEGLHTAAEAYTWKGYDSLLKKTIGSIVSIQTQY